MTYFDTANFRRPRRASQKQRKAARDLGRKRRGRSRDQWKGIALAGGAIVSVGAAVAGANALQNRGGSSSFTPQPQSSQAPQPPPPPDNSGRVPDASPSAKVTVPGFLGLSPQVRRRVLDERLKKLQGSAAAERGPVEQKIRLQAHGNPGFNERPSEAYDNRFNKEKDKPFNPSRSVLRDSHSLAHQKAQLSRLDAYKGVAGSAGKKENVTEINRIMAEASAKVDPAKELEAPQAGGYLHKTPQERLEIREARLSKVFGEHDKPQGVAGPQPNNKKGAKQFYMDHLGGIKSDTVLNDTYSQYLNPKQREDFVRKRAEIVGREYEKIPVDGMEQNFRGVRMANRESLRDILTVAAQQRDGRGLADLGGYLSRAAATVEPRRRNMRANAYLRLTAFRRQPFRGAYFN